MIKKFIKEHFTYPLHSKRIIWGKYIKIFSDGGQPIWHWFPKFYIEYWAPHWGLRGFRVCIFGREIFFAFGGGRDKNGLYSDC